MNSRSPNANHRGDKRRTLRPKREVTQEQAVNAEAGAASAMVGENSQSKKKRKPRWARWQHEKRAGQFGLTPATTS